MSAVLEVNRVKLVKFFLDSLRNLDDEGSKLEESHRGMEDQGEKCIILTWFPVLTDITPDSISSSTLPTSTTR